MKYEDTTSAFIIYGFQDTKKNYGLPMTADKVDIANMILNKKWLAGFPGDMLIDILCDNNDNLVIYTGEEIGAPQTTFIAGIVVDYSQLNMAGIHEIASLNVNGSVGGAVFALDATLRKVLAPDVMEGYVMKMYAGLRQV